MNDVKRLSDRVAYESAFRLAHYRIDDGAEPFTLLIDQVSQALLQCHLRHGVSTSAFMTAWNPYSVVCDERLNARAQQRLITALRQARLTYLPAEALDPTERWPIECGFLVLGITQTQAVMLGSQHQQHAVVWCDETATPTLQWCAT